MATTISQRFDLRTVQRSADQTHGYIHAQGWMCEGCGHRHCGAALGFFCASTACECARRAPSLVEFERSRVVNFHEEFEYVGPDQVVTNVRVDLPKGTVQ
jgi:hypothetical protein